MGTSVAPPLLTAELIEAFSGVYLSHRYDAPVATPEFHRECWRRYCDPLVAAAATAAPRGHAKTTALTHDFIVSVLIFRWESFVLLLSSTEDLAKEMLGDIADEFRENEELRRDFGVKGLTVDQDADMVVQFTDGYECRLLARGAEQKIRGLKWHGKRPGLLVADDIEDDEMVLSKERREKFRRWFMRAARQALRSRGRIRVHGTILHDDSLLAGLIKSRLWASKLYKAHRSFDDFDELLWPEKFDEGWLRAKRQEFIEAGDSEGYAQEYLNDPRDRTDAYLHKEWFVPFDDADRASLAASVIAVGVDFAISKADNANRTSFTVGGKDIRNVLLFADQRVGRWDTLEIIEQFFDIQRTWNPEVFFVEDGVIWKAIYPTLREQMQQLDVWLNILPIWPVKDKPTRGRSLQRRMRAKGCRFDAEAPWYPAFENELLRFTGTAEATLDDQFDSAAILSRGFEGWNVEQEDLMSDDEVAFEIESERMRAGGSGGRSLTTGY